MLRKIFLGIGVFSGLVILSAAGFYTKAYLSTQARINKKYEVELQGLSVKGDSAQLLYGARLIKAKGCVDCHGEDLGGKMFIDDPKLGFIVARNITKGSGGLPETYNVSDWELALKHGIRKDGKPLLIMPSHEYTLLTKEDMSAIVAYAMTVPDVDRAFPASEVGPLGNVLTELGKLPLLPAEMIDHSRKLEEEIKAEVSIEYGKYLANSCIGCHRANFKGGEPIAPGFPVVADISPTGHVGKWSEEQFINTLRTGKTPEGKSLKPSEMPWNMTAQYTETELKALYLFLRSI
jgi:mono/diheme cytochrome c family protein